MSETENCFPSKLLTKKKHSSPPSPGAPLQVKWMVPSRIFLISAEVDRNTHWRHVSAGTYMVHQHKDISSGKNKLERDFQISKHHIFSKRETLDNGLYDRFG